MATQVPPKKNAAFTFYVGLRSQASPNTFQSNPTLAAGDVKVSVDGGAYGNITTLPSPSPAASKNIKVDLSNTEMNGDNISVVFSDAAGAEWCDLIVNIQTVARQQDDLAFPTTSGRGMAVNADNVTQVTVEQWKTVVPNGTIGGRIDANAQVVGDKTAYSLSSTGLDSVAAPADITNDADARSSFIKMVRALFNRFYNKATQTSTQQIVHNDSDVARSTMTVSDDGTTQTKGKSS